MIFSKKQTSLSELSKNTSFETLIKQEEEEIKGGFTINLIQP